MLRNLKHTKRYTEFGQPYQLVLPLIWDYLISDNDSIRLLSHQSENLDYVLLCQTYSAKGRNLTVVPKIMFKI